MRRKQREKEGFVDVQLCMFIPHTCFITYRVEEETWYKRRGGKDSKDIGTH